MYRICEWLPGTDITLADNKFVVCNRSLAGESLLVRRKVGITYQEKIR